MVVNCYICINNCNMRNYIGQRFGKLLVISECEKHILPSGQKTRRLNCVCDCGNNKSVLLLHLNRGLIQSCGCIKKTQFGESKKSKIYKVWAGMKARVSIHGIDKERYYDRGIGICDDWMEYKNFRQWALNNGYLEGLTIDRIDNSKGYYPENCRFVTLSQNANNRECTKIVEYNGVKLPFMELVRMLNIEHISATIRNRMKHGWDIEKAINTPIRKGNYKRRTV